MRFMYAETPPQPTRVLVVACRTACNQQLLDAIAERASRSPARFTLLVPRPCHGLHRVVDPEDHGWQEARAVIEQATPLLSEAAGSSVEAIVGSHDPVAAVEDALNLHGFDEAIMSTLPLRLSRWLHLDLPRKVTRMGISVTTVIAAERLPSAAGLSESKRRTAPIAAACAPASGRRRSR
jgi:hypothetical protein